jgi:hypothetical protein
MVGVTGSIPVVPTIYTPAETRVMSANRPLAIVVGLVTLLACSTAPREPVVIARPPADKARVYVYRDASIYGSQVWTEVSLDRAPLGSSAPGTAFYRDVAPGTYEIEVRSDHLYADQFKTVTLVPGSVAFVKIEEDPAWSKSAFGLKGTTFVVVIIDPGLGRAEIGGLRLVPG